MLYSKLIHLIIISFHRCKGEVIRWGQRFFVLPEDLRDLILAAAHKVLNVSTEHGKQQIKNVLNEYRNKEILKAEVNRHDSAMITHKIISFFIRPR